MPDQPTSYEAAREELVEIVRKLEAGGTTLEDSLALWERGEQLATICQDWLDGARARLDQATAADGANGGGAAGADGGGAAGADEAGQAAPRKSRSAS